MRAPHLNSSRRDFALLGLMLAGGSWMIYDLTDSISSESQRGRWWLMTPEAAAPERMMKVDSRPEVELLEGPPHGGPSVSWTPEAGVEPAPDDGQSPVLPVELLRGRASRLSQRARGYKMAPRDVPPPSGARDVACPSSRL
jgi:hypothetical protein